MKVFWVMLLLTVLNVGVIVLMDVLQSIPSDIIFGALRIPFGVLKGENYWLLFLFVILFIVSHRKIMKNEKDMQKMGGPKGEKATN